MSKPKPKKGFRAKAAHLLDKALGTSQPAASPSPKPPTPKPSTPTPSLLGPSISPEGARKADLPLPREASRPGPVTSASNPSAQQERRSDSTGEAVWDGLRTTLRGLHKSAVLFPPLQAAIGGVISSLTTIEDSSRHRKEYMALAVELGAISEALNQHLQTSQSTRMSESITRTSRLVQEQLDFISRKQGRGKTVRLLEAEQDEVEIAERYREIQRLFRQLRLEASLSMWSIVNRQLVNTLLEGLKAVMLATHDSSLSMEINRRTCTENTRVDVLSGLDAWCTDPDSPNVYWMNGLAGTGKTTIACTFADMLKKRELLAASFFCTRSSAECQDVTRIIPTIAYQLARYSIAFQSALCQTLEENPDLGTRMLSLQFESLLNRPLKQVEDAIPKGLVVIIDALDECSASKGVEMVLDILLRSAGDLPLKFFVTSRPAPNIQDRIEARSKRSRTMGVLHDIERSLVQADIVLYLTEELPSLSRVKVEQLADQSGGLFIYAATAARYIQAGEETGDFDEHVEAMFSVSSASDTDGKHTEIDKLYMTVLLTAEAKMTEGGTKERMRRLLWTVVCAREPITVETLALLADVNLNKVKAMLRYLHSVLYQPKLGDVISTLHASFADFMLDVSRSAAFFCDSGQHSRLIARHCFKSMQKQLHFNICGLESSFRTDAEVPQLKERVDKVISSTLGYTCRYWGDHLGQSRNSDELDDLLQLLRYFLSEQLLFWMEVMNLKQWMGEGMRVMLATKLWLTLHYPSSESLGFAEDARNFINLFAANVVCRSTPHIYVSALPLCHRSSSVYSHYWKRTRRLINPTGAGMENRRETVLASWKVASPVNSVAYSRDGTLIAIGSKKGSIVVKDAYDGTVTGGSFEGHNHHVNSVSFSHDGTRMASGSEDGAINIWNVQDGTLVGLPLEGHPKGVTSVIFSPDGTRIVSGSRDSTARIWNTQNGALVGTPLQGHSSTIFSLSISSNGAYIASGSNDCTVRVWSLQDGTSVGGVLQGHSKPVLSVAFSPNGSRIVSGSDDRTLRVWDVQSSSQIGAPFRGHTGWVTSVAFSPDGSTVASGSHDRTIRVWDAQDGKSIGTPFDGHTNRITSLTYSPDGTRIVSGSFDSTVRIWKAPEIALSKGSPEGHSGQILSVVFSPDGSCIASGSTDRSICLWNAQDGSLIGGPFKGHTSSVDAVAFSPDGTRIISGSGDFTIRVWSIHDGSLFYPPLEGHDAKVSALAVSPDGTCIVSGSWDKTIRVWDMHNGTPINAPLYSHTHGVWSVAFSPNGTQIVAGCGDGTVHLCNLYDGSSAGIKFKGHERTVPSVAFSQNGMCIASGSVASGSVDATVCIWDANNGSLIGSPLKGHSQSVTSVDIAPDSTRVVSGSDDRTIRFWSTQDGTAVGIPLLGHTGSIQSVAFSPDSSHIVSGSRDCSIRIWALAGCKSLIDIEAIDDNGWVTGPNAQLLFWLPPDLLRCLPSPSNSWSIGPDGPICVDYSDLVLGNDWHQCHFSG